MNRTDRGAPRSGSGARPRRGLIAAAIGATTLAICGVAACQARPPADVGADRVAALASAAAPSPPARSTPPRVPVRDGDLPAADPVAPPTRLQIPDLSLTATVAAVGVDPGTGDFAVPPSVDRVGWYRHGPGMEAAAGSIVIAGHVDSATQGKGAFFRLGALRPGARVALADAAGTVQEFRVVGRERYAKSRIPLDRYFARDGARRLTLITCGGPFDAATGHYRDNVVVTAEPA